jgi:hypothetical protein
MGATKRLIEEQERKHDVATAIAVQAGVLKHCEFHSYIYDAGNWDNTPAYKLANAKFTKGALKEVFDDRTEMTDTIKKVVEGAPDECYYCAKHEAE